MTRRGVAGEDNAGLRGHQYCANERKDETRNDIHSQNRRTAGAIAERGEVAKEAVPRVNAGGADTYEEQGSKSVHGWCRCIATGLPFGKHLIPLTGRAPISAWLVAEINQARSQPATASLRGICRWKMASWCVLKDARFSRMKDPSG
jgi:hypothetical protein